MLWGVPEGRGSWPKRGRRREVRGEMSPLWACERREVAPSPTGAALELGTTPRLDMRAGLLLSSAASPEGGEGQERRLETVIGGENL